jgi:hypothetical protein
MNTQCVVLLLSCDKNIDLISQNLKFLEKYWADCPYLIFIGLEKANFYYEGTLTVSVLNSDERLWSARVKDYLYKLQTELVVVTLDDFFIEEQVNTAMIQSVITTIDEEPNNIANVAFTHFVGEKIPEKSFNCFQYRVKHSKSLLNWQFGIWRKKALLELLVDKESPWESELFGSLRAEYCSDYDFYCLADDLYMPAKYDRGWLVVRGVWNLSEIERIQKKCELKIETGIRPIDYIHEIKSTMMEKVVIHTRLLQYRLRLKWGGLE